MIHSASNCEAQAASKMLEVGGYSQSRRGRRTEAQKERNRAHQAAEQPGAKHRAPDSLTKELSPELHTCLSQWGL